MLMSNNLHVNPCFLVPAVMSGWSPEQIHLLGNWTYGMVPHARLLTSGAALYGNTNIYYLLMKTQQLVNLSNKKKEIMSLNVRHWAFELRGFKGPKWRHISKCVLILCLGVLRLFARMSRVCWSVYLKKTKHNWPQMCPATLSTKAGKAAACCRLPSLIHEVSSASRNNNT